MSILLEAYLDCKCKAILQPLKDVGSQCTAMYTIYVDFTKFIIHI